MGCAGAVALARILPRVTKLTDLYLGGNNIGKETPLLRRFEWKLIVLPRQARDKHRENATKTTVFSQVIVAR